MQTFIAVEATIYLDVSILINNLVNEMERKFGQMLHAIRHQVNLFVFVARSGLLTHSISLISAEMRKF